MSLLQTVQAIVPEARSLAEAIQIQTRQFNEVKASNPGDIEARIQKSERVNEILQSLIRLMEMEREFWGTHQTWVSCEPLQEATV